MRAAELIIERSRRIAGHLLEAAAEDIEYDAGEMSPRLRVAGTDRSVDLDEVVRAAFDPQRLPPGAQPGLTETGNYEREHFTYPNGCHIAEVEVDPETGAVTVVRYSVVDDFGRIVNPLIVRGQVMGGVTQGLGQALLERTVYDESGQLLSASFMDYCLPRADDVPAFDIALYEDAPPRTNPLGIKGCGEAGCIPAPPAIVNGVLNALAEYGGRQLPSQLIVDQLLTARNEIVRERDAGLPLEDFQTAGRQFKNAFYGVTMCIDKIINQLTDQVARHHVNKLRQNDGLEIGSQVAGDHKK